MTVNVKQVLSDDFLTRYDLIDTELVSSKDFVRNFGEEGDYVESHIYSSDNVLLLSDINYKGYKLPDTVKVGDKPTVNSLIFDPSTHLIDLGYINGLITVSYNIFRKKIFNSDIKPFFIKEISSDRTEIRLSSNIVSNFDIETGTLNFINEIQLSPYYKDFLLNFGNNNIVNAVNIALDKTNDNFTILIKLYKPLPSQFIEKSSLWIVEELSESYTYEVELLQDETPENIDFIRPANFNIDFKRDNLISSDYYNITSLLSNSSITAYQKLLSYIDNKQIKLNIDFTDFSNFIHFSSAKERLLNFVYKVSLIEEYSSNISSLNTITSASYSNTVSSSIFTNQNYINNIIEKFDEYEKYLYFESSSFSWPKSNNFPPYSLYAVTSSQVVNWLGNYDSSSPYYGGQIYTASVYDLENQSNLLYSIPEFINLDERNESFQLFINMIGQHFDNIWIYINSISDIHDNRNNINKGISRDLVYDVLKGLGIKLYNSSGNDNIFDYLIGTSISGSYTPVSESYQTLITASSQNVSGNDYNVEILKRLYHNISYLLKSKGTSRGIKALISTFGIPSTILDITEYGGSDKDSNTIEYTYDRYTKALSNQSGSYFKMPWVPLTTNFLKYGVLNRVADSIEFRFKPNLENINDRQTLMTIARDGIERVSLFMDYFVSASIPSGLITFAISGSGGYVSQSSIVPIFATGSDGDARWWNVMVKRDSSFNTNQTTNDQSYAFYLNSSDIGDGQNPYSNVDYFFDPYAFSNGYSNGFNIYILQSASLSFSGSSGSSYNYAWSDFGTTSSLCYLYIGGVDFNGNSLNTSSYFNGNLQELRLWSEPLEESTFIWHALNPESIQGNTISSSYNSLSARFTFGNNLLTYNHYLTKSLDSTHPNYNIYYSSGSFLGGMLYGYGLYGSGSYGDSGSFVFNISVNSGSFFNYTNSINYDSITETYLTPSPNAGYFSPVTEKIRIVSSSTEGYVLLPDISIENKPYYTKDTNFTDVSFSPQNEINKDIIAQYGSTLNLDDYIGNPNYENLLKYTSLEQLKTEYYKKYVSKYNYADYIKLIKYFDGSLFKMIKDFTPARTNIQTGVTIKSPILERTKVRRYQPEVISDYNYFTSSIGELLIEAGSDHISDYGDGSDFYLGEISGSFLDVNKDFEDRNFNPYLILTESINNNIFEHSEYNTLAYNVSSSVESSIRRYDDYSLNNVTYVAEVHDFYYDYTRHANPRYNGSRLISSKINEYTTGDESYDKQSNTDLNVRKFGWINKVSKKNINFYDKTTLNIKYLIDSSSNVFELNRANNNLFEVQNTFKSGELIDVSLFNVLSPTNQIGLEGRKSIFVGGFSFSPIAYRENNLDMYFNYRTPLDTYTTPLGVKAVATGSVTWQSPGDDINFSAISSTPGLIFRFPTPSNVAAGRFSLSTNTANNWRYNSFVNFSFNGLVTFANGQRFKSSPKETNRWWSIDWFLPFNTGSTFGGYHTTGYNSAVNKIENSSEKYIYIQAPASSTFNVNVSMPFNLTAKNPDTAPSDFKLIGILEKTSDVNPNTANWQYLTKSKLEIVQLPTNNNSDGGGVNPEESYIWMDTYGSHQLLSPPLEVNAVIRNFKVSLNSGDKIRVKFYFLEMSNFFFRNEEISISIPEGSSNNGYFEMIDAIQSQIVPVTSYIYTGSVFFTSSVSDFRTITFDNNASKLYTTTIFNNTNQSISESYSDISDIFEIKPGDLFRFGPFATINAKYYTVRSVKAPVILQSGSVSIVSSSLQVTFREDLNLNDTSQNNFAILRRKPDETSVILNFNKTEGEASKGMLIPINLKKDIKEDVGDIINPVKTQLLSDT